MKIKINAYDNGMIRVIAESDNMDQRLWLTREELARVLKALQKAARSKGDREIEIEIA